MVERTGALHQMLCLAGQIPLCFRGLSGGTEHRQKEKPMTARGQLPGPEAKVGAEAAPLKLEASVNKASWDLVPHAIPPEEVSMLPG